MGRFIPIEEVIKSMNLTEGDMLQRNKMRYLSLAKEVYDDLDFSVIKDTVRVFMNINKRTNTIDLPKDFLYLSGINVVDQHGNLHPVYRNDRLHDDIVDISAAKDCACECKHELCNLIKSYEAITQYISSEMPDGSTKTFTCVTRKIVDTNGFYYEESQYPQRVYVESVWTNTVLHTEKRELCKLEVDNQGCVTDCPENYTKVNNCPCLSNCNVIPNSDGIPFGGTGITPPCNTDIWRYAVSSTADTYSVKCGNFFSRHCEFNNIYNITEEGNRLIFPRNFGFARVLIRYYANVNLRNMKIPYMAKSTFQVGIKYYDTLLNDEKQALNNNYSLKYSALKFGLLKELNKYRIKELGQVFAPKTFIPSYIDHRRDRLDSNSYT